MLGRSKGREQINHIMLPTCQNRASGGRRSSLRPIDPQHQLQCADEVALQSGTESSAAMHSGHIYFPCKQSSHPLKGINAFMMSSKTSDLGLTLSPKTQSFNEFSDNGLSQSKDCPDRRHRELSSYGLHNEYSGDAEHEGLAQSSSWVLSQANSLSPSRGNTPASLLAMHLQPGLSHLLSLGTGVEEHDLFWEAMHSPGLCMLPDSGGSFEVGVHKDSGIYQPQSEQQELGSFTSELSVVSPTPSVSGAFIEESSCADRVRKLVFSTESSRQPSVASNHEAFQDDPSLIYNSTDDLFADPEESCRDDSELSGCHTSKFQFHDERPNRTIDFERHAKSDCLYGFSQQYESQPASRCSRRIELLKTMVPSSGGRTTFPLQGMPGFEQRLQKKAFDSLISRQQWQQEQPICHLAALFASHFQCSTVSGMIRKLEALQELPPIGDAYQTLFDSLRTRFNNELPFQHWTLSYLAQQLPKFESVKQVASLLAVRKNRPAIIKAVKELENSATDTIVPEKLQHIFDALWKSFRARADFQHSALVYLVRLSREGWDCSKNQHTTAATMNDSQHVHETLQPRLSDSSRPAICDKSVDNDLLVSMQRNRKAHGTQRGPVPSASFQTNPPKCYELNRTSEKPDFYSLYFPQKAYQSPYSTPASTLRSTVSILSGRDEQIAAAAEHSDHGHAIKRRRISLESSTDQCAKIPQYQQMNSQTTSPSLAVPPQPLSGKRYKVSNFKRTGYDIQQINNAIANAHGKHRRKVWQQPLTIPQLPPKPTKEGDKERPFVIEDDEDTQEERSDYGNAQQSLNNNDGTSMVAQYKQQAYQPREISVEVESSDDDMTCLESDNRFEAGQKTVMQRSLAACNAEVIDDDDEAMLQMLEADLEAEFEASYRRTPTPISCTIVTELGMSEGEEETDQNPNNDSIFEESDVSEEE